MANRTDAAPNRAALAHLRAADPVLCALIDAAGPLDLRRGADRPAPGEHYAALLRSIVGQQLSTSAARAIWGRVLSNFGGRPPTPSEVLAAEPEALRAAAGLSRSKVSFLRSLAEHVISGQLELEALDDLDDHQVVAELTAIRGLGPWTAHMFLMFQLERPDVLPVGDLGIKRAIERAYNLESLPDPETVAAIAERWRSHRTLACRYLWASLRNEPT